MHRNLAVTAATISSIVVAIACGDSTTDSGAMASSNIVVADGDDGRNVNVQVGNRLIVRLTAQLGTGYSWALSGTSEPELALLPEDEVTGDAPVPGGADVQSFVFEARTPGFRQLRFVYRRPWEAEAKPAKTFSIGAKVVQ